MPSALCNDQRDVVVLLVRAELFDFIQDRGQQFMWRELVISQQAFNKSLFSEFLPLNVECFGDAIRIQHKGVSREEHAFLYRARPIRKES